jgi:hypothetical protein
MRKRLRALIVCAVLAGIALPIYLAVNRDCPQGVDPLRPVYLESAEDAEAYLAELAAIQNIPDMYISADRPMNDTFVLSDEDGFWINSKAILRRDGRIEFIC